METMRIGDIEVLVETVREPGSEKTSAAGKAKDAALDMFVTAQVVVLLMAEQFGSTLDKIKAIAMHPDEVEIALGLKFSATGNIIVAGSTAEASLQVTFKYKQNGS